MLRRWRTIADSYDPPRVLVGETYVLDLDDARRRSTATATSCNLAFNFPFVALPLRRRRSCATSVERDRGSSCPRTRGRCGPGGNHDNHRLRDPLGATTIPRRPAPR